MEYALPGFCSQEHLSQRTYSYYLPADVLKRVENFCVHSRNGYFNSHIFHRVIKVRCSAFPERCSAARSWAQRF